MSCIIKDDELEKYNEIWEKVITTGNYYYSQVFLEEYKCC